MLLVLVLCSNKPPSKPCGHYSPYSQHPGGWIQSSSSPSRYLSWKTSQRVHEGLFLTCLFKDLLVYLFHIWRNHCSVTGAHAGYSRHLMCPLYENWFNYWSGCPQQVKSVNGSIPILKSKRDIISLFWWPPTMTCSHFSVKYTYTNEMPEILNLRTLKTIKTFGLFLTTTT